MRTRTLTNATVSPKPAAGRAKPHRELRQSPGRDARKPACVRRQDRTLPTSQSLPARPAVLLAPCTHATFEMRPSRAKRAKTPQGRSRRDSSILWAGRLRGSGDTALAALGVLQGADAGTDPGQHARRAGCADSNFTWAVLRKAWHENWGSRRGDSAAARTSRRPAAGQRERTGIETCEASMRGLTAPGKRGWHRGNSRVVVGKNSHRAHW